MSKRKQTENLHLYAYELTQGLPTFLKDWSDNMAVLDGAHSSVLALINALDGRLTSAEETITDLSPESIQDYKIRLDALEKKVVVNVNNIKDVNVKINTINAQIRSINVEQGVQNNRLLALESLGASHTELINGLRQDVGSVSDRVTNLEECCEVVKREIVDLQRDVDGFNEDITAMAGQIEDLSNTVNQLTELVNSLQLDVVAERLDAFEDSLNGLLQRMVNAESNITSQGEELIVHGERITENAGDIADIRNEIGNSDYSEIGSTVSGSLVELANRIRSLTPQEYQQLVERLDYVEVSLEGKANNTTVYQLSNRVGATESDLSTAKTDISSLQNGLSVVSSDVQENVDAIQALGTTVTNNKSDADTKIATIQSVIPNDASGSNKLVTAGPLTVVDGSNEGLIRFGVDASGNYGYKKVGADTVIPFKSETPLNPSGITYRNWTLGSFESVMVRNDYGYDYLQNDLNFVAGQKIKILILAENNPNLSLTTQFALTNSNKTQNISELTTPTSVHNFQGRKFAIYDLEITQNNNIYYNIYIPNQSNANYLIIILDQH